MSARAKRAAGMVAAALAAVSLAGCVSLLPKAKPAQLYRFGADVGAPAATAPTTPATEKIGVVLGTIGFPRASTSDGILTVTGDETAYVAGARWVAPARLLFQEAVQRAFEQHAQRSAIVDVGDVGPAGAILRMDVTRFEARYGGGGAPVIVVSISARLTQSDGRLLDQRAFMQTEPAGADRVSSIVAAFDRATDRLLTEVVAWTDGGVARIAAAGPQAAPSVVTSSSSTTSSSTTTVTHP